MNVHVNHTEETVVNAKKIALTNGLIWAVINIIVFLITYYAAPNLLGNFAYSMVLFFITIGLGVYFTLDIRKKIGGYWVFREALSSIFILFFVQYLLYYLFMLVFPSVEPSYTDMIRDVRMNTVEQVAETFGATDPDAMDQMMDEVEKALENELNPTVGFVFQTVAISVIMYFIGALIFAAIFKRTRPVFPDLTEEEVHREEP